MLWKKETTKNDALYCDIFAKRSRTVIGFYARIRSKDTSTNTVKSDATSTKDRMEGNDSFKKQNWDFALGKYNESLSYAEQGSPNIALAYANRSACFFNMKMYKESLVDIELARKNGYPANLMEKLDRREAECKKLLIEEATEKSDVTKLSFEPDEKFPFMANVLRVEKNADGKMVLVAKEDIEVGKTVVVEKAFTTCLYSKYGMRCSMCLKGNTNLLPCKKCNSSMFCSEECRDSPLHDDECGLKFSDRTQQNGIITNEVRIIFKIIRMFPNIDNLMSFVEQAIQR